jgi:acetolactate synthase-1/2/3 large subunit
LIRVSDYIAQRLGEYPIEHVFMITGGGAMHLNDSLGKHPEIEVVYNHHEQACAIAAESYGRLTGKIGTICVTSGPGGTNAITGVLGAWLDSVPMLILSGQVRFDTTVRSTDLPLRQLGDQEFDITKSVANMTKYAVMITDPSEIRYHLEKALFLAKAGRPGPCWIDIPLNIQGAMVDEAQLKGYDPIEDSREIPPEVSNDQISEIIRRIQAARRPVLFAGSAIRSSGAHAQFLKLVDLLNIPVVTAWNAHDNIADSHPLYFGRPGTLGDRAGNFIVQNADLLLVLGCRLNIRQISYNWKTFAREAFKIVVDIDPYELKKPTIQPDMPVCADVAGVITKMIGKLSHPLSPNQEWLKWCRVRKERYPVVLPEYWSLKELVNPYCFMQALGKHLPEGQITVTGNGSACVISFQALEIKTGQRLYTNSGCASMGYDLPAAIGACFASGRQKIVCLAGDGSLQMNLQELQTVAHYKLPIKIFVLNNNGYHSIRQTQTNFFGTPLIGCDPCSGVSFPDMEKIAVVYGMNFWRCHNHDELDSCILNILDNDCPGICEVMLTTSQPFAPRLSSKRLPDGKMVSPPLEDLYPFLDRDEFNDNMIIKPLPESGK